MFNLLVPITYSFFLSFIFIHYLYTSVLEDKLDCYLIESIRQVQNDSVDEEDNDDQELKQFKN